MKEAAKSLKFTDPCWTKAGDDLASFLKVEPFQKGFLTTSSQQGAGSSAGMLANHKAGMELMGNWNPGVIVSLTKNQKPLPTWAGSPSLPWPVARATRPPSWVASTDTRCQRTHRRRLLTSSSGL